MTALPIHQAEILRLSFESIFDEDESYLDLIGIDEIFALLIGGDVADNFFELLEKTSFIDENNLGFVIFLGEWLDKLEAESVQLEFYELASNCVKLKTKINEIIRTSDSGDTSGR